MPCAGHTLPQGGIDIVGVAGVGGVPANGASHPAVAVIANLTAIAPTQATYVTLYPASLTSPPWASDVNVIPREVLPNLVVVQLGTGGDSNHGAMALYNAAGAINVAIDVEGWFE